MDPYHSTYRVHRVDTEDGLRALEEAWTALLADVPGAPIFLTWEWVSTWWHHLGRNRDLWLLTAWNDAGELAGIAPWMLIHENQGPLRVRRLAFIVYRLRAHLDVIARPSEKDAVCAAVYDYLERHSEEWDVLDLQWMSGDSALRTYLPARDGVCYEREELICPFIRLPADWDTYQMDVLSTNRRQQIRRYRRKLERDYPEQVVFHRVTEPAEIDDAIGVLARLNRQRWHDQDRESHFDDDEFVAFCRDVARVALARDWLRFYRLTVQDDVIAVRYGLRYCDVFYDYQLAFDLDWGAYSPGQLLLAHVIQEAIEEGARELDFLGWMPWKDSWATDRRMDAHLLFSKNWRGRSQVVGAGLFDTTKSVGREILPASARPWINRLLAAARR